MAANDPIWLKGEVTTFQSSGETPAYKWFKGEVLVVHEYTPPVATGGNPWYYYAQQ